MYNLIFILYFYYYSGIHVLDQFMNISTISLGDDKTINQLYLLLLDK